MVTSSSAGTFFLWAALESRLTELHEGAPGLAWLSGGIRLSVPRSGAERRLYSRGGRHRRAAHWAVLSGLVVAHKGTRIIYGAPARYPPFSAPFLKERG